MTSKFFGKKEVKLSLFAVDIILYIENLKDSPKKLPELMQEFNKVAGYKIDVQKSVAFLCTNNEASERVIKHSHLQQYQNYNILGNKPTQRGESPIL